MLLTQEQNYFKIKQCDKSAGDKKTVKIYELESTNETPRILAMNEIMLFNDFVLDYYLSGF